MVQHELLTLHEHPATTTTPVIHAPVVGFKHLHQQLDDAFRRIELSALFAFRVRKLSEEVFIHSAEQVLSFISFLIEANRADQINQLAQTLFV